MKNILVLGAGVNGLTTALLLQETGYRVKIWSKETPGEFGGTSFNAYAVWTPAQMQTDERVRRWCFETLHKFDKLSLISGNGVRLGRVVDLQTTVGEPWYAEDCISRLPYFRHAHAGEITSEYPDAHVLEFAPVIDPTLYLPWLMARVLEAGGSFAQHEISSFDECPAEFDAIVNCTALGAKQLCGDGDLHALSLQSAVITINGFEDFRSVYLDQVGPNKQAHIIPHGSYIKIGADYGIEGSELMATDEEMTVGILERCSRIMPGFKVGLDSVVRITRCLRPKRSLIRVQPERLPNGRLVVHNYGHDGKAYIVSFGTAAQVCDYVGSSG